MKRHYGNKRMLMEAIRSEEEKITDKEVFLSPEFTQEMDETGKALLYDTGKTVFKTVMIHDESETAPVAFTDGTQTTINAGFEYFKDLGAWERYLILSYLKVHEMAHILYTNFKMNEKVINNILAGQIYPQMTPGSVPLLEEYLKKADAKRRKSAAIIFHGINNSLEDGFVDFTVVLDICPGYKSNRERFYNLFKEKEPSYETFRNKQKDSKILQKLILDYARQRKIFVPEKYQNDRPVKILKELIPVIEEGTRNRNSEERFKASWLVFEKVFELMLKEQQEKKESQNNQSGSEGQSSGSEEQSKDNQSSGNGSSDQNQKEDNSASDKGSGKEQKESGKEGQQQKGSQSENNQSGTQPSGQKNSSEGNGQKSSESSAEAGADSNSQNSAGNESGQSSNENAQPSMSQAMQDMLEGEDKTADNAKSMSENKIDNAMKHGNTNTSPEAIPDSQKAKGENQREQKDLESMKHQMAEKRAEASEESKILAEAKQPLENGLKGSLNKGHIHKVIRPEKSRGYMGKSKLDLVAHTIAKEIQKEMSEIEEGEILDGMYSGKRMNPKGYARHDKKYMRKETLPGEIPEMAFGILIDRSGSMRYGNDVSAASAAYMLYETAAELGFPAIVVGHKAESGHETTFTLFADEKSRSDEGDRILNFEGSKGGNRDGYAIRYMISRLEKIQADKKFLFVISDGLPSAYRSLPEAYEDVRNAVWLGRGKGIETIAVGMGSCAANIRSVYQDGLPKKKQIEYLECTDIRTLPKRLVKILKKKVLAAIA